jgi:hypothetical protein
MPRQIVPPTASPKSRWWIAPLILAVVLAILFRRSFLPDYVHFSNDTPLGQQNADWLKLPSAIFGDWDDLNDVGSSGGSYSANISAAVSLLLGPVGFAKFYPVIALFILGLGAWTYFRALKLTPLATVLGALAVMLGSSAFGDACWGTASHQIALGMDFLALALIESNRRETPILTRWTRFVLAGFCVGINVTEAADIGALYSVFIAGFVLFKSLVETEDTFVVKAVRGLGRVAVIAVFAGFIGAQAITGLISTSIAGVAGTAQDSETKAEHWDWATQWSLPKKETLGIVVPGLFGYKMDTPKDMMPQFQKWYDGGVYWGGMGRSPEIDRFLDKILQPGDAVKISLNTSDHPNQNVDLNVGTDGDINTPLLGPIKVAGLSGFQLMQTVDQSYASQGIQASVELPSGMMRFSGGGNYCGILVWLLAAWAVAQSLRKKDSPFSATQKKYIWFWAVLLVVSLLLSWGRFAPMFYGLLYKLPYFSTIRNPAKFLIFVCLGLTVLFAYGVHALSERYLTTPATKGSPPTGQLKNWWTRADGFDRKWAKICAGIFGASLLGWLIFAGEKPSFVSYLQKMGYPDEALANQIAGFSIGQVGWFVILLAVATTIVTLVIAGYFSGPRAKIGAVLLGAFLIFDLGRADLPFIVHWDYKQKYDLDPADSANSINPIINFLRDKPYEHRVAGLPFDPQQQLRGYDYLFGGSGIYRIEWAQHHFPYFNIQSLDVIQMSRMPENLKAYLEALSPQSQSQLALFRRHWELTNTRYLLGAAGFLDTLNQALDPAQQRFRIAQRFDLVPKPGVLQPTGLEDLTAMPSSDGELAVFDFTGALPRAKLYGNWQVSTNDTENLKTLADLNFDPTKTVLISTPQKDLAAVSTNENSGTVEFQSYAPKKIVFNANATAPSVLLLNDKYDPNWRVTVDGRPAKLLRCNFLMRGVQVPPGQHTVEFDFSLPSKPFYVTVSAMAIGLSLAIGLLFARNKR